MIRVVHNTVDQGFDCTDCENLEQVLERCGRDRDNQPYLYTRIRIDNLDLPDESFDRLEDISIEGVETIVIESSPLIQIAHSGLKHSSEYVAAIRDAGSRVVELFRTGRSDEANDLLVGFSDSLGVLVSAISGVASADSPSLMFGDGSTPDERDLRERRRRVRFFFVEGESDVMVVFLGNPA